MKMTCKITLAVTLLFTFTAFVQAQYSSAEEQVVYEMFEAQGMREQINQGMALVLQNQAKNFPQFEKHRNEFMAFFIKTIGYDAVKRDAAKIYLKHFTIDEIKEITKFYRSPVGQKMKRKFNPILIEVNNYTFKKLEKEFPAFLEGLQKKERLQ